MEALQRVEARRNGHDPDKEYDEEGNVVGDESVREQEVVPEEGEEPQSLAQVKAIRKAGKE